MTRNRLRSRFATPTPLPPTLERGALAAQLFGLALMIGGMLALGAFAAPVAFGSLPRPEAAALMGVLFRRYDTVLLIALALVWLGEMGHLGALMGRGILSSTMKRRLPLLRGLLLLLLTAGLLVATLSVNPAIERLQAAGVHRTPLSAEGRRFDQMHHWSEMLYKVDLLTAACFLLLTPFALPFSNQKP